MSERIPTGLNRIGANYPGQTGRITVHYGGRTYFADLEDGCAVLDLASEEEATAASRYDAPEPRQWTTRHAGVDLMITLFEDGNRALAERDAARAEVARLRGPFEAGVRQAIDWLRADYPYGSGPDWREAGCEWIADRLAEHTTALAAATPTDEASP